MSRTTSTVTTASLLLGAALAAGLLAAPAHGQTITKCQDDEGNWHYGDFASEACAENSTITEIDERGLTVRESDAPPSPEELEALESEEERAEREAERQAQRKLEEQRLLRTYDSAQSIIAARDERLAALDREVESYRLFRQDLVDEKNRLVSNEVDSERIDEIDGQIHQYDRAIQALQDEHGEIMEKFNRKLEIYRELTEEIGTDDDSESGSDT